MKEVSPTPPDTGFVVALAGAFSCGWFDGSAEKERIADFITANTAGQQMTVEQAILKALEACHVRR